ncbi:MAG: DUF3592 domain-containing protein [bacterium]
MPASRLAIAVCALLLLGGVAGVVLAWGAYLQDARLQASGTRAEGQLVRKEFPRSADGDFDYILQYRFTLPSGGPLVAQRSVPRKPWESLGEGARIVVVYSPANPRRSFMEGSGVTSLWQPVLASLLFGALAALGGTLLFSLFFRPPQAD